MKAERLQLQCSNNKLCVYLLTDATNTTSNYASRSQTQKSSHESKSNIHEIKKTNCVKPQGIIFNYNIQKRSMHTISHNKLITKENDDHTIIIESDDENNDEPVVVIVDGNISLVEYNADDIFEENDESNDSENGKSKNDENDSDVELIDTDDHLDANEQRDDGLRNSEISKEVNTGSKNKINFDSTKIINEPNASNNHDNSTVNHDLQSGECICKPWYLSNLK